MHLVLTSNPLVQLLTYRLVLHFSTVLTSCLSATENDVLAP